MAVGSGTSSSGTHYLVPSDPPDLAGITQQVAADIDGLTGYSTTWQTVGSATSINSTVQARKVGLKVSVRGVITPSTSWAANSNYTAVLTFQAGYRTSTSGPSYFKLAVGNSPNAIARLQLKSDGTVDMLTGSTAPTTIDASILDGFIAEA